VVAATALLPHVAALLPAGESVAAMNHHIHTALAQASIADRLAAARLVRRPNGVMTWPVVCLLLAATLVAGCGGDSSAVLGTGPVATPASTVDAAEIPTAPPETGYETPSAPEVQPETDAGRWVDRRQDDVLDDVHDNNMDAIEVWTP
jgi:hypothetical protein